ncbi:class I glutamine amidotransferase-like protein [Rhodocollybia butyracea]|uniref:Class I glutamine amidotransferase-like protein n=1 Tax=Rhodocollybia butyracea TaxID=206335 RepID=A0A9P5U7S3_9AGAR|nr:class I glutamine amidotransferase-like protein [Rhodocollybia butyracea]
MSNTISLATKLTAKKTYRLAVCLYPGVTTLDYQGPIELLGLFSTTNRAKPDSFLQSFKHLPEFAIDPEYLSHTREPVIPWAGPPALPTGTYTEAINAGTQFDIIMIPGGTTGSPDLVDRSLLEFVKHQAPGAKHIFTICTGSWILAGTGLLNGERATSNKALFKKITESTKDMNITWIPKARFVINNDKKIWTSSGVTAGLDMANAFLEYLAGPESAKELGAVIEMRFKGAEDDEFASVHGLV